MTKQEREGLNVAAFMAAVAVLLFILCCIGVIELPTVDAILGIKQ